MMKKKQMLGWGIACALMMVPQVGFSAGFANTAHSATATGLGGVGVANPDEPNSNFYNPASMVFRDQFNLYVGPTLIMPSVSYEGPDGVEESTVERIFPPPNFNLAVPFADNYAFGVGVTLPWGLGVAWPDDWVGRETFVSQDLTTLNVNPNFAYKIPGVDLGVAVGAQLMFSAMEQRRVLVLREDTEVDVILGGRGFGVGVTAAAMFRATEDITVGLNYRSGSTLNFDGRAHFSEDVDETPFAQQMVDQDISTSISIPHTINLGLGYSITDALWVGAEANYMTWSVYEQIEVRWSEQSPQGGPGETEPSLVLPADWSDALAFRLGAQFAVNDALKLRTGVAYDMTPVPDSTVGPSLPDNDRIVFALGAGYTMAGFRADLAYQLVYLSPRVISNGNVDGTYQLGSHLVGINLGYGF